MKSEIDSRSDLPATVSLLPELLTIDEVADRLRLFRNTIYKWARSGEIPAIRLGATWRFREDAVAQWLQGKAVNISSQAPR